MRPIPAASRRARHDHPDLGSFALDAAELHRELAVASGHVGELDQRILFLHDVEGRTVDEIARLLGLGAPTVRNRLRSVRRTMRRALFPELMTAPRA